MTNSTEIPMTDAKLGSWGLGKLRDAEGFPEAASSSASSKGWDLSMSMLTAGSSPPSRKQLPWISLYPPLDLLISSPQEWHFLIPHHNPLARFLEGLGHELTSLWSIKLHDKFVESS